MKKKIVTIAILTFLSILFWISIALTQNYIYTLQAKIVIKDLPNNYSIGYDFPTDAYIQVKGTGWNLLKEFIKEKEEFIISVHRKVGKKKIELFDYVNSNSWLASNFQVIEITPSQIEFEIEKSITKTVRVYPNLKFEFAEGYGFTSDIIIDPQFVQIKGAPTIINKIDSVKTEFNIISNIKENFESQFPLEEIPGVEFSSNQCNIKFEVQKIVDKNFADVKVEVINLPADQELILYPNKINVVIRGGINKLGKLTNDSIKAVIDFNSIDKENNSVTPKIFLPDFTSLISIDPNKLEFVIKKN